MARIRLIKNTREDLPTRAQLDAMDYDDIFKISPKVATEYLVLNNPRYFNACVRNRSIDILYPDNNTSYPEFDFDTADEILVNYFFEYHPWLEPTQKAVRSGKVFNSVDAIVDFGCDILATQYTADDLKNIVTDALNHEENS